MGTTEQRFAARAADLIARRGNLVTLADDTTFRAIPDEDPENLQKEAPVLFESAAGRLILLHVTAASFALLEAQRGRPLRFDGEQFTWHPGRKITADGVVVEVVVPCVSGAM